MIVYLDSSVLARIYLVDEAAHDQAAALLEDSKLGLITGTWSRIEVCSRSSTPTSPLTAR